jgi:hypothetical protein
MREWEIDRGDGSFWQHGLSGKQSVPERGSVGSSFLVVDRVETQTRRYRVPVLTVSH